MNQPLHPRRRLLSWLLILSLASALLPGAAGCRSRSGGEAPQEPNAAGPSPAYNAEEDQVFAQVLHPLLRQSYLADLSSLHWADGSPVIPLPPDSVVTLAEKAAYYEAYLAAHPDLHLDDSLILNLSPRLRDLPAHFAENGGILSDTAHPAREKGLKALAQAPVFATLADRPYKPLPPPSVWKYTLYWRYEPYRQYADPKGSTGTQLGLQLSRVCFNAARDSGFFLYDLDYHQYIEGKVALVCKQQDRWIVQEPE
ncbi:hypothetical protein ACW9KT_19580 [Hymenobacter sp. HD11105]